MTDDPEELIAAAVAVIPDVFTEDLQGRLRQSFRAHCDRNPDIPAAACLSLAIRKTALPNGKFGLERAISVIPGMEYSNSPRESDRTARRVEQDYRK